MTRTARPFLAPQGATVPPVLSPALLLVFLMGCVTTTRADTGFSAAWGSSSDDSNALRLSVTRPWKRRWFDGGGAHLTGYWEASLARFENEVAHLPADDGTAHLWNVAIAPVFRLQFTPSWNRSDARSGTYFAPFLDLGVGVSFMSDREFRTGKQRSRPLGSYFQFEDRGSVGLKIGRWEVAYQRMHYSNLNFASENHGIDAHLLLVRGALGTR